MTLMIEVEGALIKNLKLSDQNNNIFKKIRAE